MTYYEYVKQTEENHAACEKKHNSLYAIWSAVTIKTLLKICPTIIVSEHNGSIIALCITFLQ